MTTTTTSQSTFWVGFMQSNGFDCKSVVSVSTDATHGVTDFVDCVWSNSNGDTFHTTMFATQFSCASGTTHATDWDCDTVAV